MSKMWAGKIILALALIYATAFAAPFGNGGCSVDFGMFAEDANTTSAKTSDCGDDKEDKIPLKIDEKKETKGSQKAEQKVKIPTH